MANKNPQQTETDETKEHGPATAQEPTLAEMAASSDMQQGDPGDESATKTIVETQDVGEGVDVAKLIGTFERIAQRLVGMEKWDWSTGNLDEFAESVEREIDANQKIDASQERDSQPTIEHLAQGGEGAIPMEVALVLTTAKRFWDGEPGARKFDELICNDGTRVVSWFEDKTLVVEYRPGAAQQETAKFLQQKAEEAARSASVNIDATERSLNHLMEAAEVCLAGNYVKYLSNPEIGKLFSAALNAQTMEARKECCIQIREMEAEARGEDVSAESIRARATDLCERVNAVTAIHLQICGLSATLGKYKSARTVAKRDAKLAMAGNANEVQRFTFDLTENYVMRVVKS